MCDNFHLKNHSILKTVPWAAWLSIWDLKNHPRNWFSTFFYHISCLLQKYRTFAFILDTHNMNMSIFKLNDFFPKFFHDYWWTIRDLHWNLSEGTYFERNDFRYLHRSSSHHWSSVLLRGSGVLLSNRKAVWWFLFFGGPVSRVSLCISFHFLNLLTKFLFHFQNFQNFDFLSLSRGVCSKKTFHNSSIPLPPPYTHINDAWRWFETFNRPFSKALNVFFLQFCT